MLCYVCVLYTLYIFFLFYHFGEIKLCVILQQIIFFQMVTLYTYVQETVKDIVFGRHRTVQAKTGSCRTDCSMCAK